MRRVLIGILAVVGGFTVLAIGVVLGLALLGSVFQPGVPSGTVLEINLSGGFPETADADPLAEVLDQIPMTVLDVVEALKRARDDSKIVGLVARVDGAGVGLARAQEIRDAIADFRSSGKWSIAFTETIGEFGPGNTDYYIASAFDEIYLQPSGDVNLVGVMAGSMFMRGLFDKLGIQLEMDHRYEYKNALNAYTERSFTPAHEEAMTGIIQSWYDQIVAGVAEERGLSEELVRDLVDRGPFLGDEAQQAGLVDQMAYWDEVEAQIEERAGEDAERLSLGTYLERAGRHYRRGTTVALVQGAGPVTRGPSGSDIFGSTNLGSATVAGAIRDAIEDDRVEAILFRVDSPGGSYVASDTVWREVVRAREAGKPVVVSMGDLAGSGGYFVAMAADRIVAQPGTITGSIGVLGGKLDMSGFYEDWLGITFDEVHRGAHSTFYYGQQPYTDSEWSRLQGWLDRVYEDFTEKVADGRGLSIEQVREIAKGRIWSGETALSIGLVDALGGYSTAIEQVRDLLDLDDDAAIRLRLFPPKKPFLQRLLDGGSARTGLELTARELLGRPAAGTATEAVLRRSLRELRELEPVASQVLGIEHRMQVLSMPPTPVVK